MAMKSIASKSNFAIRKAAKMNDVFLWEVANLMGISYSGLLYKLRHEWPQEEQERVIKLIEDYVKENEQPKEVGHKEATKYKLKDLMEAYRADIEFRFTGKERSLVAGKVAAERISIEYRSQIASLVSFANRTGRPIEAVIEALKLFGFEPEEQETDNEHTL